MIRAKCLIGLCVLCVFTVILPGCGETDISTEDDNKSNRSWQIVSIAPQDYNIIYSVESTENLSDYPLDKLIAFYLGSDGACAEGSNEELYQRFICEPDIVMEYLCLIDDSKANEQLCKAISGANVYWHDSEQIYCDILKELAQTYSDGEKAKILSLLESFYNLATMENTPK